MFAPKQHFDIGEQLGLLDFERAAKVSGSRFVFAKGSLALRAHEILEDALRDRLSGQSDHGSGMAFAQTLVDVQTTKVVVSNLSMALEKRRPGLVETINSQLDVASSRLSAMKQAGRWIRLQDASVGQRQSINAAVSAALETLADIPQLLVLPQGSE